MTLFSTKVKDLQLKASVELQVHVATQVRLQISL